MTSPSPSCRKARRLNRDRHALIVSGLVLLLAIGAAGQSGVPDLQADELATGPYARMHMRYEKHILFVGVDVLTIEMRFDGATQSRFQQLATGREYSPHLAEQIASAAVDAQNVFVSVEFQRDVSLAQWVGAVRDSLGKAERWGVIDQNTYRHVSDQLPNWFSVIADRGFREGDRILYRGRPDRMRTVLVGREGRVLVDHTDDGSAPRRAMLGGYLAPGGDFRAPLVRSLLNREIS